MLWRALQHVENGFYIDVGAQDPIIDSVSLAFYEHGWRGIHVEPTRQYSEKLRSARPDEIVEQVAIGSTEGMLTFYEFGDTGLSTADSEIADRHIASGFKVVKTEVSVITLDYLLEAQKDKAIHWLKIDVEGMEKDVLQSWVFSSRRPWILIIESTKPGTKEESHKEWEELVQKKGYTHVYFDGLNRFYVHQDHPELLPFFSSPPNIFDGFVLSGTASQPFYDIILTRAKQAESRAGYEEIAKQQAEAKTQQAEAKTQEAEAKAKHVEANLQQTEALLIAIQSSTSWKLTAPLRYFSHSIRQIFTKNTSTSQAQSISFSSIVLAIKAGVKFILHRIGRIILRYSWTRKSALLILNRMPELKQRLHGVVLVSTPNGQSFTNAPHTLSPRAERIYVALKKMAKERENNAYRD